MKITRIEYLLAKSLPGKASSKNAHIKRGEKIAGWIAERWGVREPYQWKAKHLAWVLKEKTCHLKQPTQYGYWCTCRVLSSALGRWPDWQPYLRGSWTRPKAAGPRPGAPGGRPPKLPRR